MERVGSKSCIGQSLEVNLLPISLFHCIKVDRQSFERKFRKSGNFTFLRYLMLTGCYVIKLNVNL